MENLWSAAIKIFGEENKKDCKSWFEPLKEYLWNGEVAIVLNILNDCKNSNNSNLAEACRKLYDYFDKNKDAMRYKEFREAGYYIGSGAIESANKYIITSRMKMTGCRWLIEKADQMIWLRAKYFEDHWDVFWEEMKYREFQQGIYELENRCITPKK